MHRYVMVFYVMIPRNLVGGYQHFGETYWIEINWIEFIYFQ
jgi:hypothetical protein